MRRNFSKNHRASAAYDRQKKKRSTGVRVRQSYDDTYYRQKNALPAKKRSDAAEKRAPQGENKRTYDAALIAVILILVFFGLIMVFSASAPSALAYKGNEYHYILRQAIFALIGILVMFFVAKFDYHIYAKFAFPILAASFFSLFTVYIPGLGKVVNDARRWIGYGIFSLQPSEIAKIGVIIYFSYSLSLSKTKVNKFWQGLFRYLVIMGAFALVLMAEPHFSCTVVLCLSCVVILFVAGARIWHFGIMGAGAAFLAALLVWLEPYRLARVLTFVNPFADTSDKGYQIANSLYAIGSGGIFGLGLGMSRQKLLYLPEAHNDFIFAIVCEELGLLGAAIVIILFIMLIWRGYRIAQTAPDNYGSYLATGITSLIGIQAALNIAVVTSSVPVTGVALPFFSYGGTSLVILLASMGILLNISKQCKNLGQS